MRKIYFLLIPFLFSIQTIFAGVNCTIDTSNTAFFNPRPDSLPCVERGVLYTQTLQIKIPTSIDLQQFGAPISFILTVDSVVFDSVGGLPNGLNLSLNPFSGHLKGGQHACAVVSGTTNDPTGNYPLTFYGNMTLHGAAFPPLFDGDTTIDLAVIQSNPQNPFHASLDVIDPGAACRASTNVRDFNAELNSFIQVFPNPNNGAFEFRLNAGRRVNGEIVITDVTGRKVYTEQLDAVGFYSSSIYLSQFSKGLYTLQLRTANGFDSKNISIE